MSNNTGNRGYTSPDLADSNDVPFYMQTLAEQVDADVAQIFNQAVFLKAITVSSSFSHVSNSATYVNIPLLTTTLNATAGKRYRIMMNVTSQSTNVNDVVQILIKVNGTTIGDFPKQANSSLTSVLTANYHTLTAYWVAPTTASVTITSQFCRVPFAGSSDVTLLATTTRQASITCDDLGLA